MLYHIGGLSDDDGVHAVFVMGDDIGITVASITSGLEYHDLLSSDLAALDTAQELFCLARKHASCYDFYPSTALTSKTWL